MATPIEIKEQQLRRYLSEDKTWTPYEDVEAVPQGWIFVQNPDGGVAAWRKPPQWALRQPAGDPIRPRVRGGLYKP